LFNLFLKSGKYLFPVTNNSIGSFFGYVADGIFQSYEEIKNDYARY